jgi:AcrR family transcriptional regulator
MDSNSNKKRVLDAAKTRKKILKAAASLFVKNGFDGISISQIAKKAGINQSLIYHYFDSKEDLWKSVKNYYVETHINIEDLKIDADNSLKEILTQIISSRLEFYAKHPEIIRMMAWQKLETDKNKLVGGTRFSPDNWKEVFSHLQKQGKIKADINLDMMILFITSLIAGALTEDYIDILNNQKNKQRYTDLIMESCMQTFSAYQADDEQLC